MREFGFVIKREEKRGEEKRREVRRGIYDDGEAIGSSSCQQLGAAAAVESTSSSNKAEAEAAAAAAGGRLLTITRSAGSGAAHSHWKHVSQSGDGVLWFLRDRVSESRRLGRIEANTTEHTTETKILLEHRGTHVVKISQVSEAEDHCGNSRMQQQQQLRTSVVVVVVFVVASVAQT